MAAISNVSVANFVRHASPKMSFKGNTLKINVGSKFVNSKAGNKLNKMA